MHRIMRASLAVVVVVASVCAGALRANGAPPSGSNDRAARAAAGVPGKTATPPPAAPAATPDPAPAPVARPAPQPGSGSIAEIPLRARDGHAFSADVYEPASGGDAAAILLVPDLGKTRKELAALASALRDRGYRVFSMDNTGQLRNVTTHGALRTFTPVDSRALPEMVFDVSAAGQALESHPHTGRYLAIGFGIGANLAMQYAEESDRLAGVALVMPGFGCEGANPYEALGSLRNRPALLIETKKRQVSDLSRAFHAVSMGRKDLMREQIFIDRTVPAGQNPQTWLENLIQDRLIDWTGRVLPPSAP